MYISIKKRRVITAVIASMVILGFTAALVIDAFSDTSAAYSAQMGVRQIVRYDTYKALEPELGELLVQGDYGTASSSLTEVIASSLTEQGIDMPAHKLAEIRERVERELKILGDGGYIVIDDDGNISEESKSYISNMIFRIISGYLPEEGDQTEPYADNYDFSITSLEAVQDLKKQIGELEDLIGEKATGLKDASGMGVDGLFVNNERTQDEVAEESGTTELEKLRDGLMAVETIIDTMEHDLNRQAKKIDSSSMEALAKDEEIADELAEQNIKLLAQYDSITGIEKRILEIYREMEQSTGDHSERLTLVEENLNTAVGTIEALKEQMSDRIDKGESSLFDAIDETTKDLIRYKASMETVTDDLNRSIENLEASMSGTITSNYEELREALKNSYDNALTTMYAVFSQMDSTDRKLENSISETGKMLQNALNMSDERLTGEISSTDRRLREEIETARKKLEADMATDKASASRALQKAYDELLSSIDEGNKNAKENLDSTAALLDSKIDTADDTISRLISSILTKAGAMDKDSLMNLVETTCHELSGELNDLKTLLEGLRDSVMSAEAGSDASREAQLKVLGDIDDLLAQINTAGNSVDDYETKMQQRIEAADTQALRRIRMSDSDEEARQALIDASSVLIELQNAQSGYDRELRSRIQELSQKARQITAGIGDLGQMLDLETQVGSLTRSIDTNVDSLNNTIGELGERMNSEVSDLNMVIGELGSRVDEEVMILTGNIGALNERMSEEVSGLTGSIGALDERMNAEVSGLTGSIGALDERVNAEVSGLTGSIGALDERVNAEVSGLTGSIGALDERVNAEVSGLTGSIGALDERMNAEVSGLNGSIGELGERMNTEVTGLTGSIGALGERMDAEVSGLTGSIGALDE
nr:hypothetical protein [Lachnospiraceae bacterium]